MVAPLCVLFANRFGRAVALAMIGNTLLDEELIRQRLAQVFTRYCDRPICEQWERLETEARNAVLAVDRRLRQRVERIIRTSGKSQEQT